jgi:hypothetical protein
MRVANRLFAVLFVIAALLQLNDPDPVRWFTLYAAAAAACWVHPPRPFRAWLAVLVCIVALVWAIVWAPRVVPTFEWANLVRSKDARFPAVEDTRELFGLLIVSAWMGVRAITLARSR